MNEHTLHSIYFDNHQCSWQGYVVKESGSVDGEHSNAFYASYTCRFTYQKYSDRARGKAVDESPYHLTSDPVEKICLIISSQCIFRQICPCWCVHVLTVINHRPECREMKFDLALFGQGSSCCRIRGYDIKSPQLIHSACRSSGSSNLSGVNSLYCAPEKNRNIIINKMRFHLATQVRRYKHLMCPCFNGHPAHHVFITPESPLK